MFNLPKREKTGVEIAIDKLLLEMQTYSGDDAEYAQMVDQLVKLEKLKSETGRKPISPDTLAAIAANLGGILIIVGYEQKHILATKALSFIRKV